MKLAGLPQSIDDFAGEWVLTRSINDALTSQTSRLEGRAVFTRQSDAVLDYREEGALHMAGGHVLQATRRYIWSFDRDRVSVCFDDGSDFHSFALTEVSTGRDHLCGQDLYKSQYDFTGWPNWQCRWTVQGPKKTYSSFSRYSR